MGDDAGKMAASVAVRLVKGNASGGPDLLHAISQEMAALNKPIDVQAVLVLEDEPLIQLDIEHILRKAGYTVKACSSRNEASDWLASRTPMAAVLDFRLRDGDCTTVANMLQSRGVPIIFCSASHPSDLPSGFQAAAWLHKPFDDTQLTSIIHQAVEMREFHQRLEAEA
ncbi:response regulator [Pararhizobium qamdonense]|uniref:response regulator n=1 Tax=Pararhizobium qamdonense TaxID=3031126 RepID=UPI0023E11F3D|nr:response regulator [Pararhizobium qamdonense]